MSKLLKLRFLLRKEREKSASSFSLYPLRSRGFHSDSAAERQKNAHQRVLPTTELVNQIALPIIIISLFSNSMFPD